MKAIFIPAKWKGSYDAKKIELDKMPKKIGIVSTAQFLGKTTEEIMAYLENNGKKTFIDKMKQANAGQLLGCDQGAAIKIQDKVDAYLYIGSGEFHPLGVGMKTDKEVFTFNPVTSQFGKLDRERIKKYLRQKEAAKAKFLNADRVGLMVSLKRGQFSYKQAVELKEKLERKGKEAFIFVCDTLDASEMMNFPFIEFWVNTACPRIADDPDKSRIVDMAEIKELV